MITEKTLRALKVIDAAPDGTVSAGFFSNAMGYHKPENSGRMRGQTGASVLRRLAKRDLVVVWDDWWGNSYVTLARLSDKGKEVLRTP